jgi:hypothetical protein
VGLFYYVCKKLKMVEELIIKYSSNNERKNFWNGSKFEPLIHQTSDARGVWGEELVEKLFISAGINCVWNKDKNINQENGIWDILVDSIIKKVRLEVKTAFKDTKDDKWQHDNIYKEDYWDVIIFVDVDYDKVYFTIQQKEDIPFDFDGHKILKGRGNNGGKKSTRHLSAWKFDLNKNQIKILESHGFSFTLDMCKPDYESLNKFFIKHIIKPLN